MMSNIDQPHHEKIELFILPIQYQTLSFHHSSHYYLRIQLINAENFGEFLWLQSGIFEQENEQMVDRLGNISNVGGQVINNKLFHTNKFHIQYNDQIMRFNKGIRFRVACSNIETLQIMVSLIKLEEEKANRCCPRGTKKPVLQKSVCEQSLILNLRPIIKNNINSCCYRKIIFTKKQYISYLNLAYAFTIHHQTSQMQPKANLPNAFLYDKIYQQYIKALYQRLIIVNIKSYSKLRQDLLQKIESYKAIERKNDSFTVLIFQRQIIDRQIYKLDYVAHQIVRYGKIQENVVDSQHQLKRSNMHELQEPKIQFLASLCKYYQCEQQDLQQYIEQQSKLLQINISYLFNRLIQILFALKSQSTPIIFQNQIKRIQSFINHTISQLQSSINKHDLPSFSPAYQTFMASFSNYTKIQMKSPHLYITNEPLHREGKVVQIESVLIIFVHGYKGNQYDLSKIKSYLSILFGFHNFYSIKGLSSEQIVDQNISKLATVAAQEINQYLALNTHFSSINIIGFSLGGIIARALVPQISSHHKKLNLLMTIASPHLGIRGIKSCIIRSGLCLMRNFCKVSSMKELNNEKNGKQQFFMQNLAQKGGIQHFNWIVLIGSLNDSYIPMHSSLVEYDGQDLKTNLIFSILKEKMKRAIRCEVKMYFEQSCWQSITKRKGHIIFLQDDSLIKQLLIKFSYCFLLVKK